MHNNRAVQFKILSLHRVNKLGVKQCTHRCQWVIINDVDIAVDTQSYLHRAGPRGTKLEAVSLLAPPKQTNGKISGNIYPIWKCPGNHTGVFCFFGEAKQQGLNRGDKSSLSSEGTHRSAVALEDGFSQRFHGQRLGGRKDIKAFSQSWQKNTGKWVDPVVLTKSRAGSARVPCFHTEPHCCGGWSAGKAQSAVSQLRLLKVDVNLCHCVTVIFREHCNTETIEFEPNVLFFPKYPHMPRRLTLLITSAGDFTDEFRFSTWKSGNQPKSAGGMLNCTLLTLCGTLFPILALWKGIQILRKNELTCCRQGGAFIMSDMVNIKTALYILKHTNTGGYVHICNTTACVWEMKGKLLETHWRKGGTFLL